MRFLGKILIFISLLIIFNLSGIKNSSAGDTVITADSLEQQGDRYTAQGRVRVKKDNTLIDADEMTYNHETSEISLDGNILYEDPEMTIKARRAHLNLEAETGVLYDAEVFVKKDNYRIKSKQMEKTHGRRYLLKDASLTTCNASPPAWCLRGSSVDIVLGDRLVAKGASLRVKGIPVLYTPYLWAPILIDRKTGLLMPTVGYSETKGFYWRQPFFWAVKENMDFTFFLDGYTERGIGEAVEHRYIKRKGFLKGNTYLYHMGDGKLSKDFYELRAVHEGRGGTAPFPAGGNISASGYINLNIINHREFPRLYKPYLEDRSRRFWESNLEVQSPLNRTQRVYLRGNYFIELKEGVSQSTIAQRLPEIGFVQAPVGMGPAQLSFASSLANFQRQAGTEGQRLTFHARASHTAGKTLTLSQAVGARETLYQTGGKDGNYSHETVDYTLILQNRFIKDYGTVSHAATPSVSYKYIFQNGNVPPLFDSLELFPPQTTVELSLMNRFMDKSGEFFTIRASEVFDSRNGNNLKLGMLIRRPFNLRANTAYNLKEGRFEDANSEMEVNVFRVVLSLGQSYARQSGVLLHTFGLGYAYSKALSLKAKLWYDSKEGEMSNFTGEISYERQCWAVEVSLIRRPDDLSVFLTINLKGLGSFKTL